MTINEIKLIVKKIRLAAFCEKNESGAINIANIGEYLNGVTDSSYRS